MTVEEGELYITLAALHGPSTRAEDNFVGEASHDPLHHGDNDGEGKRMGKPWWVYRSNICGPYYATRAEAAKAYCDHYNITP